jgi:hypothetical protein
MPRKKKEDAREPAKITQQCRTMLALLEERGDAGVSGLELARLGILRYSTRAVELRAAGHPVVSVKYPDGVWRYKLGDPALGVRRPPRPGHPAFYFVVGPIARIYASPPYKTALARDAAALAYHAAYECDADQFAWFDTVRGGNARVGVLGVKP